ncbi:MAG TPA: hypothetical protein VG734_26385 [Lacunisphaera sp.]|nr:hypothetical protein [Lacunisphaera sp.]
MRLLLLLLLFAVGGLSGRAQTAPVAGSIQANAGPAKELPSAIRGLFDFDLPTIDPPGTMTLVLHPHLGDFVRRDYMRVEGGLKWAINDHFEIRPEATVYFTHGLGGSSADGYGVGEARLSTKYILRGWPDRDYETSVFFNMEVPVGSPPVDLTDGFNHYAPGFLIQHKSMRWPKLTTFSGAGLDIVSDSPVEGMPVRNQPLDDSMNFTAGAIYDLGQVKWTLSATYATTAGLGDATEHFYYLRPSLLWYVPKRYTFNSDTQWIIGLGLRASHGPDGNEFSFSNRVRAELTFRQMIDKVRRKPPQAARP